MSTALCLPSGSSQRVFQNTPGRRSIHGILSASGKKLVGDAVMMSSPWSSGPSLAERLGDGLAEGLDGQGTDEGLTVDEEGRRLSDAERAGLAHVRIDLLAELPRVEARREGVAFQS